MAICFNRERATFGFATRRSATNFPRLDKRDEMGQAASEPDKRESRELYEHDRLENPETIFQSTGIAKHPDRSSLGRDSFQFDPQPSQPPGEIESGARRSGEIKLL